MSVYLSSLLGDCFLVVLTLVLPLNSVVVLESEPFGQHFIDNSYLEEIGHEIAMPDCTCMLPFMSLFLHFFVLRQ